MGIGIDNCRSGTVQRPVEIIFYWASLLPCLANGPKANALSAVRIYLYIKYSILGGPQDLEALRGRSSCTCPGAALAVSCGQIFLCFPHCTQLVPYHNFFCFVFSSCIVTEDAQSCAVAYG
jgi:hypothetical protein